MENEETGYMKLRSRYGIPSMSKVIRLNCLNCCIGQPGEVRLCQTMDCSLWPYRFGRNPKEEDLRVRVFDKNGDQTGWEEYPGFPGSKAKRDVEC